MPSTRFKLLWLALTWLPMAAAGAAWAMSYAHHGVVSWSPHNETAYFVSSRDGRLGVSRQMIAPGVPPGQYRADATGFGRLKIGSAAGGSAMMSFNPHAYSSTFLGFGVSRANGTFMMGNLAPTRFSATSRLYAAPYWALSLAAAVPPFISTIRRRRTRGRAKRGQCLHCGYDLRATPGRCPECGATSDAVAIATPGPE